RENQHQWLDSDDPKLFLIRSGSLEIVAPSGEAVARLSAGDYFGYPSLLSGEAIKNRIEIKQEALVYILSQSSF
ncbi:cyclic nucleotide-binding domain-containing protein, partial [Pseudoalteromonas sp. S407]